MISALITFVIIAIVVGVIAWVLTILVDKVPMDGSIAQIIKAVIWVVAVVIILLQLLGLVPNVGLP